MIDTVRKLTLLLGEKQVELETAEARIQTLEEALREIRAEYAKPTEEMIEDMATLDRIEGIAERVLAGEGEADRE